MRKQAEDILMVLGVCYSMDPTVVSATTVVIHVEKKP